MEEKQKNSRLVNIPSREYLVQKLVFELISPTKIAKQLGIKYDTLNHWINKYKIEYVKFAPRRKNLRNKKFGKLTPIKMYLNQYNKTCWECKCDCGNIVKTLGSSLLTGNTTSCGCYIVDKQYKGFNQISGITWSSIKKGARQRNLEFLITIEYIWDLFCKQDGLCAISGLPLSFSPRRHIKESVKYQTASLDRIDSKKGYVVGNVQWVHKDINMMKHQYPQNYFVKICHTISDYQRSLKNEKATSK